MPRRVGWYQRLFAWAMAGGTAAHETAVAAYKRRLLGDLHGTILEIGPGAGANFAYYPPGIRWVGVEPNPYMHPYLRRAADAQGVAITIHTGTAEHLPVADGSVDAVVSTLVLCSVEDVGGVLREVQRVLRPGGRFVFVEHVAAAPGTRLRRIQGAILPLWRVMGDGCHPDRETGAVLDRAGFAQVRYEPFDVPMPIIQPHIAGVAVKAGETPG